MRQRSRRQRVLVLTGLTLTSGGVALLMIAVPAAVTAAKPTDGAIQWAVTGLFIALAGLPAALGMWLAHLGEPGIGRRFAADIVSLLSTLRRPSTLARVLRTSLGLGLVTFVVTSALMLLWQRGSILTALAGLTLYSVLDPALNVSRRSWWLGAALSSSVWVALLTALANIANAIEPVREGAMVFLLPMMLFGAGVILSGIVRAASAIWR